MSVDVIWGMKSSVVVACPKILNPFECFPSIVWVCMVVMHGLSQKTNWLLSSYAVVGFGGWGGPQSPALMSFCFVKPDMFGDL